LRVEGRLIDVSHMFFYEPGLDADGSLGTRGWIR
jgi:hypothetical protein